MTGTPKTSSSDTEPVAASVKQVFIPLDQVMEAWHSGNPSPGIESLVAHVLALQRRVADLETLVTMTDAQRLEMQKIFGQPKDAA